MSDYIIEPMDESTARIVGNWQYERPYDFYNMTWSDETYQELMGGSYFTVRDELLGIVGFCCFGEPARVPFEGYRQDDHTLDIGLGMRPDLTGKGLGGPFVSAIMEFGRKGWGPKRLRLTVATFNRRAFALYERLRFEPVSQFCFKSVAFTVMERATS